MKPDDEKNHLPKDYRRWTEPTEDFRFFMESIMPAIAPHRCKFHEKKGIRKLSEIYTVSDEAFGLVVLLNELHCWEEKANEKETGVIGKTRKTFVNGRSGNKQGWNIKGVNIYNRICKNLQKRRLEQGSMELERKMYEEYAKINRCKTKNDSSTEEEPESDFEDADGAQQRELMLTSHKLRQEKSKEGDSQII